MKNKKPKKTSTVILTLIITVVIVTALIIGVMALLNQQNQMSLPGEEIVTEVANGKFYDNGWDSSVVAEIRDGVPIPVGYTYVSGEKDTGLLIYNEETGKQYVWIPYDEEIVGETSEETIEIEESILEEVNSYFDDKTVASNPDKLAEIQKYGGFYAEIEFLSVDIQQDENTVTSYSIAEMTTAEYESANTKIAEETKDSTSVDSSIMGQEELTLILAANDNQENGINISTQLLGESNPWWFKNEWKNTTRYISERTIGYKSFSNRGGYNLHAANGSIGERWIDKGEPVVLLGGLEFEDEVMGSKYYIKCQTYDGRTLYISNKYMSEEKISSDWTKKWNCYFGGTTKYANKDIRLYDTYLKNNTIQTVSKGSKVTMYAMAKDGTGVCYVKVGSKYGYVNTADISAESSSLLWTEINANRYTTKVCYIYSTIEKTARNRTPIRQLTKGTTVYVYKKATIEGIDWVYAKANGYTGYMLASNLTTQNPNTTTSNTNTSTNNANTDKNTATATNSTTTVQSVPNTPTNTVSTNTVTNTTTNTEETNTITNTTTDPTTEEQEEVTPTIPAYTGEVITVKPGDSKIEETAVPDEWKGTVSKIVNGVPIPEGFEVAEYYGTDPATGFVIKQSNTKEAENLHRLCYVWVPVDKTLNTIDDITQAKSALNDVYTQNGANTKTSESATETLPEELVQSIKEYGGFYIAQGELGYDNNAKLYNRPRGMVMYDNGWYGVDYGNYFRYVGTSDQNKTEPINYVAASASYYGIINGMTVEKINQVCQLLSTDSVTSHLTYGAEWDAMMLWILKQDANTSEDLASLLIKDSSSIGKYAGSISNIKLLNSVWGLAGNLSEVTQEKVDGKIVVRGGSYSSLGTEQPVASRTAIDESEIEKSTEHGFRNCLYINLPKKATQDGNQSQTTNTVENTVANTVDNTVENTVENTLENNVTENAVNTQN